MYLLSSFTFGSAGAVAPNQVRPYSLSLPGYILLGHIGSAGGLLLFAGLPISVHFQQLHSCSSINGFTGRRAGRVHADWGGPVGPFIHTIRLHPRGSGRVLRAAAVLS